MAEKGSPIGFGRTADIFTWGNNQILKLFHENWDVVLVEEEARIGRLMRETGLPVPNVGGTAEVSGRHGIIYERVDGPTMLQRFSKAPWALHGLTGILAELHVSIHEHRVLELPSRRETMVGTIVGAASVPTSMKDAALKFSIGCPRKISSVTVISIPTR